VSLIDEALKRAQAAQEGERERDIRPWSPPPLPDPRRTRQSQARWAILLGSAAAILVAALLLWRSGRLATSAPRSPSAKAPAPATGLPPISSDVAVAPPRAFTAPEVARSRGEASTPSGSTTAPGRPAASSATPAPGPAIASAPRGETRETRPHSAGTATRSYAGEMPLPGGVKITLDGIVFSEESQVAVVNGRVLPVGGFVEGYEIVQILPDRVELERDGARVVLTLR